jgi:hypothetical protein
MLLYGGGLSDSDQHSHRDLPLVLVGGAGGRLGGRVTKYSLDTPMNNLLSAMLEKVDAPIEQFGDATGTIPLEPLSL